MPFDIRRVSYISEYKLMLKFEDGLEKILDLEQTIASAWAERDQEPDNLFIDLHDKNYFKRVYCQEATIKWPNGLELCPDVLYES